jgi:hypothetical protein
MHAMSERVVAQDDGGVFVETITAVARRFDLRVSCSCWRHRLPFAIEVIQTPGGSLFFRRGGSDEVYREIGMNGPITIEVAT